jgi:tetratricopeptide (TPR) repeat protein
MRTRPALLLALLLSLGLPVAATPLAPEVAEIRSALRVNDLDAAIEASEAATEQRPDDALAWLWAGRAYGRQAMAASMLGKPRWAGRTREAWETAVKLDPNLVDARLDLMQYYLNAPGFLGGGRELADAEARTIAALNPSMGKLAQAFLAQVDDKAAEAEAGFREALVLDPANTRARMALSGMLQRAERWDESRVLWQERLDAAADDAMARYQLARWSALRGEQLEAGLAHVDAFIAANSIPEDLSLAAAHWRRGNLLEKLGRVDEARAAYQLAKDDASIGELVQADLKRITKG